jgi:hypothetical protein
MLKPEDKTDSSSTGGPSTAEASSFSAGSSTPATPPKTPSAQLLRQEIRVWTRDLLIAIGLALVIIVFLYQPVKVEGTSMAPLLSDQERIFINKFVYRFEPIERGDVVVFWYPLDRSKSFIKRIIGLPGETVEIRRGAVSWSPSRTSRHVSPMSPITVRYASPAAAISSWVTIASVQTIPGFLGRSQISLSTAAPFSRIGLSTTSVPCPQLKRAINNGALRRLH